ncbi:hypothetical protein ANO14919_108780 [Xylariales sp. No.14919]|nr:hypothetical protein ANO14919_108780 [Xylariales sp. No.14919]
MSSNADIGFAKFPWGCKIAIDNNTHWPVTAAITHERTCRCSSVGSEHRIVRDFLFNVAYEYYYKKDSRLYHSFALNEMVEAEAKRLGISLDGCLIWDYHPDCLPSQLPRRD